MPVFSWCTVSLFSCACPANVCDSMWEYENGICKETNKIENKQSDRYMYIRFALLKNKGYLCFSFRKRYLNIH